MRLLMALFGSVLLLAVAAFCLFGFLASFESNETTFVVFRIGYAVIGAVCLAGILALVVNAISKSKSAR